MPGGRAAAALRGAVSYQGVNVRFSFAGGLAAQIVSQKFSQNATPAIDSGRFSLRLISC